MTSLTDRRAEIRRLWTLLVLSDCPAYRINLPSLYSLLDALAVPTNGDLLRTDVAWLAEQGYVETSEGKVVIATLTSRGLDVARGKAVVPGVARPDPELRVVFNG